MASSSQVVALAGPRFGHTPDRRTNDDKRRYGCSRVGRKQKSDGLFKAPPDSPLQLQKKFTQPWPVVHVWGIAGHLFMT